MYDGHWCDQVERWTTGHCEGALTVGGTHVLKLKNVNGGKF